MKIKNPDSGFFLHLAVFLCVLGLAAIAVRHYVFAASFDIADYPGKCFTSLITVSTNNYIVNLHTCIGGETQTPYSIPNADSISVQIDDTSLPLVNMTSPSSSGSYMHSPITVSVVALDAAGISHVDLYVNSVLHSSKTFPSNTATGLYEFNWTPAEGYYYLQAKAYDGANNYQASAAISVTVDNTAPTATISAPVNNATVLGTVTVTVAVSTTDASGIQKTGLSVDGGPMTYATTAPWNILWDTTTVGDGPHTIQVTAFDNAGNTGSSTITNVIVDNNAPTVSISAPTSALPYVKGDYPFTAIADDAVGVDKVEFYINGALLTPAVTSTTGSDSFTYSWNSTGVADGTYNLMAKAYDAIGHYNTATLYITVDNYAPTVNITYPSSGAVVDGTVTATATASDASGLVAVSSGIHKIGFYVDGGAITYDTTAPYSYDWVTNMVANGSHTIYAKAVDYAGNVSTVASVGVNVNNAVAGLLPTTGTLVIKNAVVNTGGGTKGVDDFSFSVNGGTAQTFESDGQNDLTQVPGTYNVVISAPGTSIAAGSSYGNYVTTYDNCSNINLLAGETKICTITNTYAPGATTGVLSIKKIVVNTGGGTKQAKDFSFSVNGDAALSFETDGQNDLNKTQGTYTVIEPVYANYITTYSNCSNVAISAGGTATCVITNTYTQTGTGTLIVKNNVVNTGGGTKKPEDFYFSINNDFLRQFESDGQNNISREPGTYTVTEPKYVNYETTYDKCSGIALESGETKTCVITNTYVPPAAPCVYTYNCGKCGSDGKLTCSVATITPSGVKCKNEPITTRDCVYEGFDSCTAFEYTEWSECSKDGKKIREIKSSTPVNCKGGLQPYLEEKCVPSCEYVYSAWGDCIAGKQKRIVLDKSPQGCEEKATSQILEQKCQVVAGGGGIPRAVDAPAPVPESVVAVEPAKMIGNFNGRTSSEWQAYYFGAPECAEELICGGEADPDLDGITNNDEYRFGTDPKIADTDHDGYVDGQDILEGRNPVVADAEGVGDKMNFEDPRIEEIGVINEKVYLVGEGLEEGDKIETLEKEDGTEVLKLSGKALPNTYITIYVYSDPIIMTVKTDADGNWLYVLDKPLEEGEHVAYVTANGNDGKVVAKSAPLLFVQTAEAATVLPRLPVVTDEKAPSPVKSRMAEGYFVFGFIALAGLLLTVFAISIVRKEQVQKPGI